MPIVCVPHWCLTGYQSQVVDFPPADQLSRPPPSEMSAMKHNPPRQSSNSLSSQASLTLQTTTQPGAGKGKGRKNKDHSPPSPFPPDGNSVAQQQPCSLAIPITSSFVSKPNNKQGFRFSLRRMLHSPLISQRRARSLSGGNNIGNPAPSSSSTGGLRKRQSPSTCECCSTLKVPLSFHFG